jgi:hypothetical protein
MSLAHSRPNYAQIASAARTYLPLIALRWLPDGRREGREWVARNPTRSDRRPGSFKVNLHSGKWADFATGEKGGDVISLAAYLYGLSQSAAADKVSGMIGLAPRGGQ